MPMTFIRAFIAISLSEEVCHGLDQVLEELKSRIPGTLVRWVPARNIHLTLKFLGDVSSSNLEILKKVLHGEAGKHNPMQFSVGGIGAFPSIRRPRVIWIGVQAPQELQTLQRGIELETTRLGYAQEERDFSPHLTLGRVSRNISGDEVRHLSDLLSDFQVGSLGVVRVDEVHLYRSDLTPAGAIYTRLFTARLASEIR